MAADRIIVNKSKTAGSRLVALAEKIADVQNQVAILSKCKDHGIDASDYTVFESDFGLPAGTGANVATLIGLIDNLFNTNATVAGVDRFAQLNEFIARLSTQ